MDRWDRLKEKLSQAEAYYNEIIDATAQGVLENLKLHGIKLAQQYMFDIEIEESGFSSNK